MSSSSTKSAHFRDGISWLIPDYNQNSRSHKSIQEQIAKLTCNTSSSKGYTSASFLLAPKIENTSSKGKTLNFSSLDTIYVRPIRTDSSCYGGIRGTGYSISDYNPGNPYTSGFKLSRKEPCLIESGHYKDDARIDKELLEMLFKSSETKPFLEGSLYKKLEHESISELCKHIPFLQATPDTHVLRSQHESFFLAMSDQMRILSLQDKMRPKNDIRVLAPKLDERMFPREQFKLPSQELALVPKSLNASSAKYSLIPQLDHNQLGFLYRSGISDAGFASSKLSLTPVLSSSDSLAIVPYSSIDHKSIMAFRGYKIGFERKGFSEMDQLFVSELLKTKKVMGDQFNFAYLGMAYATKAPFEVPELTLPIPRSLPHAARIDPSRYSQSLKGKTILGVNGIDCKLEDIVLNYRYLKDLAGPEAKVAYVGNPTQGKLKDVLNCLKRFNGETFKASDEIEKVLRNFHLSNLDNLNEKILVVAHSAGNIDLYQALSRLPDPIRQRVIAIQVAPPQIIPKRLCHESRQLIYQFDLVPYSKILYDRIFNYRDLEKSTSLYLKAEKVSPPVVLKEQELAILKIPRPKGNFLFDVLEGVGADNPTLFVEKVKKRKEDNVAFELAKLKILDPEMRQSFMRHSFTDPIYEKKLTELCKEYLQGIEFK